MFTSGLNPVLVFVHPQEVQATLDNADVYAQQETVVQGGQNPNHASYSPSGR
ncbi:hypothetical protein [Thermotoga maritima]|uniref:hypothetical protein n=1 Tax=Thermotoga maritima TaxID=2336 RepID=UPI0003084759|nr:hypothetical protein [Thermotoga maritima]AGL49953.1 hypothetical protein Tmari_1029 [Thermotoga maritima MSB8]